jgi:hypothetical protein
MTTKITFYKKVGRRYIPVKEYDPEFADAMPKGNHLISVYPGGKSGRYNVDPAFAPMIAAGRYAEDAISSAIVEASKFRASRTPITQEQREAWSRLCIAFGDDRYMLNYDSARGMAEKAVETMTKEAEKLLSNPAVKKAYDHFMLVSKLAAENKDVAA